MNWFRWWSFDVLLDLLATSLFSTRASRVLFIDPASSWSSSRYFQLQTATSLYKSSTIHYCLVFFSFYTFYFVHDPLNNLARVLLLFWSHLVELSVDFFVFTRFLLCLIHSFARAHADVADEIGSIQIHYTFWLLVWSILSWFHSDFHCWRSSLAKNKILYWPKWFIIAKSRSAHSSGGKFQTHNLLLSTRQFLISFHSFTRASVGQLELAHSSQTTSMR